MNEINERFIKELRFLILFLMLHAIYYQKSSPLLSQIESLIVVVLLIVCIFLRFQRDVQLSLRKSYDPKVVFLQNTSTKTAYDIKISDENHFHNEDGDKIIPTIEFDNNNDNSNVCILKPYEYAYLKLSHDIKLFDFQGIKVEYRERNVFGIKKEYATTISVLDKMND